MTKHKLFVSLNFLLYFQLMVATQALAFRGGERVSEEPREQNFSHRELPEHNAYHRQPVDREAVNRQAVHQNEIIHSPAEKTSLAQAHHENVSAFSQQHLKMNPHAGIPNNSASRNLTNKSNNSVTQNQANNNTYNYYGNSGWNGNNFAGSVGWGGGLVYGALFGATLSTALLTSYSQYNQPLYYPAPSYIYNSAPSNYFSSSKSVNDTTPVQPATSPIDTATPSDETWIAAQDGKIPERAVINNTENGKNTYYCRTSYNKELNYGVLVVNDGCYIETSTVTMRFTTYEVLTKK